MPAAEKPRRSGLTLVPDRVVGAVEARYGITVEASPPILLDAPRASLLPLRSETCRKAVLEAREGTFFLKEVPWYCDEPALLDYRLRFEESLRAAGLPLPETLRTRDGARWLESGGVRYVLSRFVRGRGYGGTAAESEAAGRTLAALHRVPVDPGGAPGESPYALAAQFLELAADTLCDPAPLAPLKAALRRIRSCADDFDALPRSGVHGDYSPSNLLFAADATPGEGTGRASTGQGSGPGVAGQAAVVAAVLDFDNADHATPLHDLAEALVTFGTLRYEGISSTLAAVSGRLDEAVVGAFVRGYTGLRPLSAAEAALLPAACVAVIVELASLGLLRGDLPPEALDGLDACRAGEELAAVALDARSPVTSSIAPDAGGT